MARQQSIFPLSNSDVPNGSNELKFDYDPEFPGNTVRITFPSGCQKIEAEKLAELGILFIALADTTEPENGFELLQNFKLQAPFFMHLNLLAKRVARRLLKVFSDTYSQKFYSDENSREKLERALAVQITTIMRDNA